MFNPNSDKANRQPLLLTARTTSEIEKQRKKPRKADNRGIKKTPSIEKLSNRAIILYLKTSANAVGRSLLTELDDAKKDKKEEK